MQENKMYYPRFDEPKEFFVSAEPCSIAWKIKVDGEIADVSQFNSAVEVLGRAKEDDKVIIYLQSPGGSLDATDSILHAMRNCEAPIHIVATGNCSSAATFILLESDSFELSDNFNALLHCGSVGAGGNTNEFRKSAVFYSGYMEKTLRKNYEGFLSEKELDDMLNGQDIWLDAQAWCDRFVQRMEYFKAKADQYQAEVKRLENELAESSKFTPADKPKRPVGRPRKVAK